LITGKVEANVTESNSLRWLGADRVDLALAGGGKAPVVVRGAQASAVGGARLRLVDANVRKGSKGKATNGVITTSVKADLLTARLGSKAKTTQITGIDGTGRTVVERTLVDETGQTQWHEVSSGDALLVDVRPVSGGKGREELARAEQHGSVRIVREAAAKGDATGKLAQNVGMEREDAQGDNAVYDASSNHLTMMGQVSVADADSRLFADRVEMDRASGDATAEGNVRVSYLQAGSVGEPVHVLAARAVAHKATGLTEFFAATGGNARMWQGGSQVQASVLEFDRNRKTLRAREVGAGAAVKTVLIDTAATRVRTGMLNKQTGNAPVRVLSRELLYSDAMRQVTFRGAVQLTDQDGVMRAQEATVFLAPKDGAVAKDASAAMSLGGRVERMVATGNVELEQPGRRASGDKLVYTASDKTFVLTGTNTAPPKLTDEAQGSVTGAQLRFRSGDDSVEVLSGDGSQRVRTETRIKQKESQ
jgi:lipopolysaccharide export system protein LptA